jgi:RNA-directed DNA polymerase
MPKSTQLLLANIADWHTIALAMHRACVGKQNRSEVINTLRQAETNIAIIAQALRDGRLPIGQFRAFTIHDPKTRLIHAAPLLDRVAHHALIHHAGPTIERRLIDSVFACRKGKGVHRAIDNAQQQSRRFDWVLHVDIKHYFPNIDHLILRRQLHRIFKGDGLRLIDAVIDSHQPEVSKGLPIGALTSQYFANHYLNEADRWALAQPAIGAHCRYMDDFLFFSNDRQGLLNFHHQLAEYLADCLALNIKPTNIQRSRVGFLFCGIHVKPFSLKPSLRRRRRCQQSALKHRYHWLQNQINDLQLQQATDAALAILHPAQAHAFKQRLCSRLGGIDA